LEKDSLLQLLRPEYGLQQLDPQAPQTQVLLTATHVPASSLPQPGEQERGRGSSRLDSRDKRLKKQAVPKVTLLTSHHPLMKVPALQAIDLLKTPISS
jgi:hypothetical protein